MKRRKAGGRRKKGKANLAGGVRQELGTGGPSEAQAELKSRCTCQGRAKWAGGGGGQEAGWQAEG